MKRNEIRGVLLDAIENVAPGCIPASGIDDSADIRDQLDLDSMDILNIVDEIDVRLGVAIPDADVATITTIARAVDYIESALAA